MTRYVGLCVGGPKDGEMMACSQPYFQVSLEPPILPNSPSFRYGSVPNFSIETRTYRLEPLLRGAVEIDLWVYEDLEMAAAANLIFEGYIRDAKLRKKK